MELFSDMPQLDGTPDDYASLLDDLTFIDRTDSFFIQCFYKGYKHLPLLFIYQRFLDSCTGKAGRPLAEFPLLAHDDWSHYNPLLNEPFLWGKSPVWVRFYSIEATGRLWENPTETSNATGQKIRERADKAFPDYIGLLQHVGHFRLSSLIGRPYLLHSTLMSRVMPSAILTRFQHLGKKGKTDTDITWGELVLGYPAKVSDPEKSFVELLNETYYNYETSKQGLKLLTGDEIDYKELSLEILAREKGPITFKDLQMKVNGGIPRIARRSEAFFYKLLKQDKRIYVPKKSGKIVLREWVDKLVEIVREQAKTLLEKEIVPLRLAELVYRIKDQLSDTPEYIISECIQHNCQDFIEQYKSNYCGLKGRVYPEAYIPLNIGPFSQRFQELQEFLDTNKKLPVPITSDMQELGLYRWLRYALQEKIEIDTYQKKQLQTVLAPYNPGAPYRKRKYQRRQM